MPEPLFKPLTYRELFVVPVLEYLGEDWANEDRISLIINIANHESDGFRWTKQIGGGPARGLTQIEGPTHDDIWINWLAFRRELAIKAWDLTNYKPFTEIPSSDILVQNHGYGVAMTAFTLRRAPGKLPAYDDIPAQARYWKLWYNTPAGAGTEEQFITRAKEVHNYGIY